MQSSDATAANAWVDSYLNALLTFGLSSEYASDTKAVNSSKAPDADRTVYSRYYVRSLLNLDEDALKAAWSKAASATRHGGEKDHRLEFLAWRIWEMKRRRKQVRRQQKKTWDDEASAAEAPTPAEYSSDEDAKKGVKKSSFRSSQIPSPAPERADGLDVSKPRKLSVKIGDTSFREHEQPKTPTIDTLFEDYIMSPSESTPMGPEQPRLDRLYVVMISLHGLVRGERMQLGCDSDTGGQVKYVVELARAMALHPAVYRVDLLTRLIRDPKVDPDYGVEEERIAPGHGAGDLGGAFIVRLPCGPVEKYINKEALWPHVPEFADQGVAHVSRMLTSLTESGHRCELYAVHGHYADAGEVAVLMTGVLDATMVMTGHSLGRNKLEHLLSSAAMTRAEIDETYAINRRIEAEERSLDNAMVVFTSTEQEVEEQWGLYDGYNHSLARVLRFHRSGRHMPLMKVSPPGLDFTNLKVQMPDDPVVKEFEAQRAALADMHAPLSPKPSPVDADGAAANGGSPSQQEGAASDGILPPPDPTSIAHPMESNGPPIWQEISRFLRNPLKPAVLAMSRPDAKKNIATLIKAFGEHHMLRELANLVLIMGNRDTIDSMAGSSQKIMLQALKLIDAHNLYGSVAYPKHHTQADITDIYAFAHETRGVFVNIALQEPFGLTVIEAAAHGVPTVATCNGGPVDILSVLKHGVLVEPTDSDAVAEALLGILTQPSTWDRMSHDGHTNITAYSWPAHCKRYMEVIDAEKKFVRSYRKQDRTLSGLLDKKSKSKLNLLDWDTVDTTGTSPVTSKTDGLHLASASRLYSMPPGALPSVMAPPSAPPAPTLVPRTISGMSTDDLLVLQSLGGELGERSELAGTRSRFLVVPLDSDYCLPMVARTLCNMQAALQGSPTQQEVGIGVLSMLGFDTTCKELEAKGVRVAGLDFMTCNAGADLWLQYRDGRWEADESYEALIEWQWDRIALHRMLKKVISQPAGDHKRLPRLKELLYNVAEVPEEGIHPRHVCLELDRETTGILAPGMGPKARETTDVSMATIAVQRLKRRMRSRGFRMTYTLQLVPRTAGIAHLSALHITPARASRANCLRFLLHKLGMSMSCVTLVALAPEAKGTTVADMVVGPYTNDMGNLVAGMHRVFVVPKPEGAESVAAEGQLIQHMGVPLTPFADCNRVFVSNEDGIGAAVLEEIGTKA